MESVAVIDYGMGNLRSVHKALQSVADVKQKIIVSDCAKTIAGADRIVFPGQGAIRDAMGELTRLGLADVILQTVAQRPTLGICLGLQALFESSEESPETPGLGVFAGKVKRFRHERRATGEKLKVPHMGWNTVTQTSKHPLWHGVEDNAYFYFVHSYFVCPSAQTQVAATCRYGVEFACAMHRGPLFAVQFHPEKSQRAGLTLLHNFLRWQPS